MTTKWEYKQLYSNGGQDAAFNVYGAKGWELVGVTPDGLYTFKRLKPEEIQIAPEPEVSVTLTYSDMVFLQTKFSRWVYPNDAQDMVQFARIEQKLKRSLESK